MEVDSIILRTSDVERSTEFWSEVVGLAITNQLPAYTFLEGGNISIILAAIDRPVEDDSFTEIVLMSDDVQAEYKTMAERGVPFESDLGPPIMSRDGKDLIAAHFQDFEGHYGRLTGWVDSA